MSLSKYYKNSDSFQPEKIVKHKDAKSAGWEDSVINKQASPQRINHSAVDSSEKLHQTENDVELPEDDNDIATNSSVVSDLPGSQELSPNQTIDLNNYTENSLAEERIEEAYRKGLLEGEQKLEEDFGTALRALLSGCQQLETVRETLIINSRKEVLDFSLAIAERILRISVQEQDSTIIATIEEALQRAVKSDEFTIYIHPDDYETVMENASELVTGISGLNNIVVKKDITIEQGGTKIESANCTIDATIGSQFNVIREELIKRV